MFDPRSIRFEFLFWRVCLAVHFMEVSRRVFRVGFAIEIVCLASRVLRDYSILAYEIRCHRRPNSLDTSLEDVF